MKGNHPGVPDWANHTQITRLAYKTVRMLKNEGLSQTVFAAKYVVGRWAKLKKLKKGFYLTDEERKMQSGRQFPFMPKISIIVPLFNTPDKYFTELLDSVKNQSYGNWELCLADGSNDGRSFIRETVDRYISEYGCNIVYKKLERNGGISENTNAAIEISSGDYIGLLDHDDLLAESALYDVVDEINRSGAEFLYSDEATFIDRPKDSESMHLKPDYSPYYLNGCNYICHFSVIKRELAYSVGLYHSEYDGSQDFDFTLRITEKAGKIVHIPKPLYWWRIHPGSVAEDISSKPYAYTAAKRAVEDHLKRTGVEAEVLYSRAVPMLRVKYAFDESKKISILIPTCDHTDILDRCIRSIEEKTTYKNYEIILIENNSKLDETFRYYDDICAEFSNIRVVRYPGSFNFSAINNFGFKYVDAEYTVFCNNDIEIITPDWFQEMAMFVSQKDVGACGVKLLYPDDTIQHGGIAVGVCGSAANICPLFPREHEGYMSRLAVACDMSACTAALLMVKSEVFREVGEFTEELAVSFNDVDLCLKIREKGYSVIFNPECEAYHYESRSRGYDNKGEKKKRMEREKAIFRSRWPSYFEELPGDPFYNHNFGKNSISYDA